MSQIISLTKTEQNFLLNHTYTFETKYRTVSSTIKPPLLVGGGHMIATGPTTAISAFHCFGPLTSVNYVERIVFRGVGNKFLKDKQYYFPTDFDIMFARGYDLCVIEFSKKVFNVDEIAWGHSDNLSNNEDFVFCGYPLRFDKALFYNYEINISNIIKIGEPQTYGCVALQCSPGSSGMGGWKKHINTEKNMNFFSLEVIVVAGFLQTLEPAPGQIVLLKQFKTSAKKRISELYSNISIQQLVNDMEVDKVYPWLSYSGQEKAGPIPNYGPLKSTSLDDNENTVIINDRRSSINNVDLFNTGNNNTTSLPQDQSGVEAQMMKDLAKLRRYSQLTTSVFDQE